MKTLKTIANFFYWFIIIFLILIAVSTTTTSLKIPFNYKLLVVQSGSMEPVIKTGSIVLVKKNRNYSLGEVITFSNNNKHETITHRIVNKELLDNEILFTTRGDSNQAPDREQIKERDVLGAIIFTVPYFGYIINFTKTQKGFIFLIVVPATIIIFSEILNLKKEMLRLVKKKKEEPVVCNENKQWRYLTHD